MRRIITHKTRPSLFQQRDRQNLPPYIYRKLGEAATFVEPRSVPYDLDRTRQLAKGLGLNVDKHVRHKNVGGQYALLIKMHTLDGSNVLFGCEFMTSADKWKGLPLLWFHYKRLKHMDGNELAKVGKRNKRWLEPGDPDWTGML